MHVKVSFWTITILLGAAMIYAAAPGIRLVDIATSAGLTISNTFGGKQTKTYILESTGNGAAIFDFDGDGANDILITNGTTLEGPVSGHPRTVQLYHNDGHGHFTDVSRQAGFTVEGWAQGVCVGDYNNDGRPDVLITYYGYNRLYKNLGNGTFADVTTEAHLPVAGVRYGAGCSFFDYDRDGWLDLFVANYIDLDLSKTPKPGEDPGCNWKGLAVWCGPHGLPLAKSVLYHNNHDGTFTDVSEAAGILKAGARYNLGVATADLDNDGWPDIYVACDQTPSLLYHNRHDGTFEERGVEAGVAYNFDGELQSGMGVAVADYNGDGLLDIAKTNFSGDIPSLFKNENGKFFEDVAPHAGLAANHLLGWGIAFVDLDDDGWKDLVIANGHVYPEVDRSPLGDRYLQKTLVYRNLGNGKFEDITSAAGPALAVPRPARGLAVGDLDGDGRPEIAIVNMNSTPSLLKNTGPRRNFLSVVLEGTKSNRSAIGARITVEAGGRRQIDEVMSGGSFYSQNDFALYFGLGDAKSVDRMEVRWPSGAVQEWKAVPVNQKLAIREGEQKFAVRKLTAQ
ncbi:MAG TPA: CRTAC1 family protein [Bryobacteraceae bacterium]|nr:CRTAC1 family protein [Bryobacteraceae bacterium]